MSTFIIAQGATSPALVATLSDIIGNPVDLSAAISVVFLMTTADGTTTITNAPAAVFLPATSGQVTYQWISTDTANAGTFLSRFVVTFVNSTTMQFPDRGYDRIVISPTIPSLSGPIPSPGWNYSGDPQTSPRDAVRFLIADTNSTDQLMQDGEIDWLLSENRGIYSAAAQAARQLAAHFLRLSQNKRLGDLAVAFSNRAQWYIALTKQLTERAFRSDLAPTPYAGGISEVDKEIDNADPDIIHRFKVSPTPDIYMVP